MASSKFIKLARDKDGNHSSTGPYILRTDWDKVNKTCEEMCDIARLYYDGDYSVKMRLKEYAKRSAYLTKFIALYFNVVRPFFRSILTKQ